MVPRENTRKMNMILVINNIPFMSLISKSLMPILYTKFSDKSHFLSYNYGYVNFLGLEATCEDQNSNT